MHTFAGAKNNVSGWSSHQPVNNLPPITLLFRVLLIPSGVPFILMQFKQIDT